MIGEDTCLCACVHVCAMGVVCVYRESNNHRMIGEDSLMVPSSTTAASSLLSKQHQMRWELRRSALCNITLLQLSTDTLGV